MTNIMKRIRQLAFYEPLKANVKLFFMADAHSRFLQIVPHEHKHVQVLVGQFASPAA